MVKSIVTSAALLTSIFTQGCAHEVERGILHERSEYEKNIPKTKEITRTKGVVKKAWLHAHEMPSGDYFGGAWIYLLIEGTTWKVEK